MTIASPVRFEERATQVRAKLLQVLDDYQDLWTLAHDEPSAAAGDIAVRHPLSDPTGNVAVRTLSSKGRAWMHGRLKKAYRKLETVGRILDELHAELDEPFGRETGSESRSGQPEGDESVFAVLKAAQRRRRARGET